MSAQTNIVLLDGGFGNQLFQISFALYLLETSKQTTMLNYQPDARLLKHGTDGIEGIIRHLNLPTYTGNGRVFRGLSRLAALKRSLGTRKHFETFSALNSSVRFKDLIVFSGYWQEFEILFPYYSEVAQACNKVLQLKPQNSAVIHARFGDYEIGQNRKIYTQLGDEYYLNALTKLKDESGVKAYKVVSNNAQKAKEMFLSPTFKAFQFTFPEGSPMSDFATMAQASTLVGTNSTFCWWAALTAVQNGTLANLKAPEHWFQPAFRHRTSPSFAYVQRRMSPRNDSKGV